MKLNDIINEEEISEIPVGIGSRIKTAVKSINPFSVSGRNQAQGQLSTGKVANQIYGEFYKWIGQTGKTADANTVIEFLKQFNYGQRAIDAAQKVISSVSSTTNEAQTPRLLQPNAPTANFGKGPSSVATRQTSLAPSGPIKYSIPSNNPKPIPQFSTNPHPTTLGGSTTHPSSASTPTAPQAVKPLDKQGLNAIFLAVAQSQPPQQGQQPQSSRPQQQSSLGNQPAGQPSTTGTPTASTTIDIPSIVEYYKSLPDDNSRQALRVQLDQADAELSKATPPNSDFVSEVRENERFSRFLGINL